MKTKIGVMLDMMEKQIEKCPWAKKQSVRTQVEEICNEAKEVVEAVEKGDKENLTEEIGDLLWDAIMVAKISERDHGIDLKAAAQNIIEKMERRKPWVYGDEVITDIEETIRRWNEIKAMEKQKKVGEKNG